MTRRLCAPVAAGCRPEFGVAPRRETCRAALEALSSRRVARLVSIAIYALVSCALSSLHCRDRPREQAGVNPSEDGRVARRLRSPRPTPRAPLEEGAPASDPL